MQSDADPRRRGPGTATQENLQTYPLLLERLDKLRLAAERPAERLVLVRVRVKFPARVVKRGDSRTGEEGCG